MMEGSHEVANSASEQSNHNPKVQHAGKAHIRGKIRRVWRPRYLELLDSGLVRYYELPNVKQNDVAHSSVFNPSQSGSHLEVHRYSLKCVISVSGGSRILDGTTLRDMHVGLPRGSYGFMFRGQKLATFDEQHRAAVTDMSSGYVTNLHTPSLSSVHDDLPTSSCMGNPIQSEPRDFWCAVSTLEEAQMWVVALQWAASPVSKSSAIAWWASSQSTPDLFLTSTNENNQKLVGSNHGPDDLPSSVEYWSDPTAVVLENKSPFSEVERNARLLSVKSQRKSDLSSSTSVGQAVVSKVVKYKTVRTQPGLSFQFEIAYEIHCMLVQMNATDDNEQNFATKIMKEPNAIDIGNVFIAEQWSMLRTADDFQTLITNLCKELGPSLLDRAQLGPIKQLPRWINKPTPFELQNSLSIVDSILRSLVMDVAMVNAQAMKAFLGLLSHPTKRQARLNDFERIPILSSLSFWNVHDSEIVIARSPVAVRGDTPVDQFVKKWMISKAALASSQKLDIATFLLQRPLWIVCGIGFTTVAGGPMSRFFGHHYCSNMPTIMIRLDLLVASWVGAAYLGKRYLEKSMIKNMWVSKDINESKSVRHKSAPEYNTNTIQVSGISRSTQKHNDDMRKKTKMSQVLPSLTSSSQSQKEGKDATLSHSDSSNDAALPKARDEESSSSGMRDGSEEDDGVILSAGSLLGENDGSNDVCSSDDDESIGNTTLDNEMIASGSGGPSHNQLDENSLSSPLPQYNPDTAATTSWSQPSAGNSNFDKHFNPVTFYVRGSGYLHDRVKIPSGPPALKCRGIDLWITDNPERHIARHPAMLGTF